MREVKVKLNLTSIIQDETNFEFAVRIERGNCKRIRSPLLILCATKRVNSWAPNQLMQAQYLIGRSNHKHRGSRCDGMKWRLTRVRRSEFDHANIWLHLVNLLRFGYGGSKRLPYSPIYSRPHAYLLITIDQILCTKSLQTAWPQWRWTPINTCQ